MASDAELLAKVEAAIEARLDGGGFNEYSELGDSFKGETLANLYALRQKLKASIAASGGSASMLGVQYD